MKFKNRREAAALLAEKLKHQKGKCPLVLAVPRGAIEMGQVVSERLGGDLDVLLVHKFSHPLMPEYALGSVSEDGEVFLGEGSRRMSFAEGELSGFIDEEMRALYEKRDLYTPFRQPIDARGRVVIIVDDGIATGATLMVGIQSLQARGAARVIVAAPVASQEAVMMLLNEGVEVVVLSVPHEFTAVGQHYEDFDQVTNETVIEVLKANRRMPRDRSQFSPEARD